MSTWYLALRISQLCRDVALLRLGRRRNVASYVSTLGGLQEFFRDLPSPKHAMR